MARAIRGCREMVGRPPVDPWMAWIHRWPRTPPMPSAHRARMSSRRPGSSTLSLSPPRPLAEREARSKSTLHSDGESAASTALRLQTRPPTSLAKRKGNHAGRTNEERLLREILASIHRIDQRVDTAEKRETAMTGKMEEI